MKTSSLDREIRARIDTLLSDITQLVKSSALQAVQGALGGPDTTTTSAAPRRRGPGRPPMTASAPAAPAARKGKRAKRSSEDVIATANAFLAHVNANPGQSVEQIGKALGITTKELQLPVVKLVQARAVRTEGQKRGTRYFAAGGGGAAEKRGAAKKSGKRGRRAKKA